MENLLGAGYALRAATRWSGERVAHFHGVWASAPGMAGLVLSELCDTPFSLSGHAYDLFERGGDGWLREKARSAQWVRTSTEVGRKRLLEIGVDEAKVLLVRRGLPERPPFDPEKAIGSPCRIVSVGRMVTKMGFDRQIPLYTALKQAGFLFRVDWIGDGPERSRLEQEVDRAGLSDLIRFRGRLPYEEVETFYQRGDIFVFTGRIDCNGDRAGLPNAIAEAMAWGLPVFATDVGAVGEAVRHAQTGFLWPGNPAAEDILDALANPANLSTCRQQAYQWVENMFDSRTNLAPLLRRFSGVTFCRP
ncbi:MAG TPA: glycosyltransferase family 4 protein, partial [Nitrospiria bacterium]|nr:glycosyltransferase family 4 protein [Nitrospiria bacterium]